MSRVEFTPLEKILMEKADTAAGGRPGALPHLLTGAILCALLVYSYLRGVSPPVIFWPGLCYVILATVQGISSSWAISAHKVLVRKLVKHAAAQRPR